MLQNVLASLLSRWQAPKMASKYTSSPIYQVREAVGMTGEEFAALLGISVGSLRNMERGTLAVSDSMAEKLFIAFGVDPKTVKAKEGRAQAEVGGRPYDRGTYDEWRHLTTVENSKVQDMIDNRLKRVKWVLEAAVLNGSIFGVDLLIDLAVQRIVRQCRLEDMIRTRLRQDGAKESWLNFDSGSLAVCDHVIKKLEAEQPKAALAKRSKA